MRPPSDPNDDQVVVLAMWLYMKVHKCELKVPEARLLELIDDMDRVHEAILKAVRVLLRPAPLAYS